MILLIHSVISLPFHPRHLMTLQALLPRHPILRLKPFSNHVSNSYVSSCRPRIQIQMPNDQVRVWSHWFVEAWARSSTFFQSPSRIITSRRQKLTLAQLQCTKIAEASRWKKISWKVWTFLWIALFYHGCRQEKRHAHRVNWFVFCTLLSAFNLPETHYRSYQALFTIHLYVVVRTMQEHHYDQRSIEAAKLIFERAKQDFTADIKAIGVCPS